MARNPGLQAECSACSAPPAARMGDLSDFDLVGLVRAGRLEAFETIMRRHNQKLFRVARSVVKNDGDAEDVVQEAYIRAYTKINDFIGPGGFSAWLTRIAFNEALGVLRRRKPNLSLDAVLASPEGSGMNRHDAFASGLPSPQRLAESSELRKILEATIESLPVHFRVVFMLRAIEGLSVEDTAESLDIPEETVKTRYHRARRFLQKAISGAYEDVSPTLFQFDGLRCDNIVELVMSKISSQRPPTQYS